MITLLICAIASAGPAARPPAAPVPPPPPPVPAIDVLLESVSGDDVAKALQDAGFRAEVTSDSGNLLVKTAMAGKGVHVKGYDCDQGTPQRCKSLQIFYGETNPFNATLEQINSWNERKRYAQAVLTTGNVVQLSSDVRFFGGGSLANLTSMLQLFDELLGEYLVSLQAK